MFNHPSSFLKRAVASSPSTQTEQNEPTPMRELRDEFMNANSVAYLEEIERRFKEDGNKGMDQSWSNLLKNLDNGMTGKELSSMWEDAKNGNAPVARERKAALNGSPVPSEGTLVIRALLPFNVVRAVGGNFGDPRPFALLCRQSRREDLW